MEIGKTISQLRKERKISQETLAKDLNIVRSTLACYETDRSHVPYELLVKIAKYFDVTTDYLLGLEDY